MKGIRVRLFGREILAVEVQGAPPPPPAPPAPAKAADKAEPTPEGIKGGAALTQERRWAPDHSGRFGFGPT